MSRSQETSGQDMKQGMKQDKTLPPPLKKPWTDPKFSRYGSVAELTEGGSTGGAENPATPAPAQPNKLMP